MGYTYGHGDGGCDNQRHMGGCTQTDDTDQDAGKGTDKYHDCGTKTNFFLFALRFLVTHKASF